MSLGGACQQAPLEAGAHFAPVALGSWVRALELCDGQTHIGASLAESASPAGGGRRMSIGRRRVVEAPRLLVVSGNQAPVRVAGPGAHQCVGNPAVQNTPDTRGRQLIGDLAKQLVAESPAVGAVCLEHERIFKNVD